MNYYNEIDPYAAQWLRNLIEAGHIPYGEVDTRSIVDVTPGDTHGFTQCHFFAGIGGWSLALRTAGWPDARHVWTGSCPCQPFSVAGKRKGTEDERHLWPVWERLIAKCQPDTIFGEQVARAASAGWWDIVANDLEGQGYTVGACVLPASAVGAPHRRDRLWFVADAERAGLEVGREQPARQERPAVERSGEALADAACELSHGSGSCGTGWSQYPDGGWWAVEPGMGRVAHGAPARVGRLRAYGNAIVPQVAAEFIGAYLEV